jgi:hypothetical protein
VDDWYVPTVQLVQDPEIGVTPAFEYVPIAQTVHPAAPHEFGPPLQFLVTGLEN